MFHYECHRDTSIKRYAPRRLAKLDGGHRERPIDAGELIRDTSGRWHAGFEPASLCDGLTKKRRPGRRKPRTSTNSDPSTGDTGLPPPFRRAVCRPAAQPPAWRATAVGT